MPLFVDIRRGGGSSEEISTEEENSSENDQNSGESDKNVDNSGDLSTSGGSGASGSSGSSGASGSNENSCDATTSSNSASGEVKATSTSSTQTAITYDEENDYLYYEDGEYPQGETNINFVYNSSLTFYGTGVDETTDLVASFDETSSILSFDGTISGVGGSSMTTAIFYKLGMSFLEGEVYSVVCELVAGSVDNYSGSICLGVDVCNSSMVNMSVYDARNYVDFYICKYETCSNDLIVNSTSEEYGAGLSSFLWVASGATATFNNAQYKITVTYADLLETAYEDGEMSYAYDLDVDGNTAVVYTNKYQVADAAAGTKFARIEVGGSVGWFAVEPIRWILTYGSTLPSKYVAVSEKVLSVGSYKSKSSANLTYSSLYSTTNQSSSANLSSGALAWSVSDSIVYDAFNTTASQTAVFSENLGNSGDENTTITAAGYRVASVNEIDALGGGYATESTDFCSFVLSGGTSTTSSDVAYWARDLAVELDSSSTYGKAFSYAGGYNQGVYVTSDGVISNATLTNSFGARFSMATSLANICDDGDYLVEDYNIDSLLTGGLNVTVDPYSLYIDGWEVGHTVITFMEVEWSDLTFNEDDDSYIPLIANRCWGNVTSWEACVAAVSVHFEDEGSLGYVYYASKSTGKAVVACGKTITDEMISNSYYRLGFRVDYISGGSVTIKKLDVIVI